MITGNPSSLENFFLSAIFANAFDLSAYCAALSEAKGHLYSLYYHSEIRTGTQPASNPIFDPFYEPILSIELTCQDVSLQHKQIFIFPLLLKFQIRCYRNTASLDLFWTFKSRNFAVHACMGNKLNC